MTATDEWSERSKLGDSCSVLGCQNKPSAQCPTCSRYYCYDDILNHRHVISIIGFLDNLRKPESLDPMHKWIGTYNLYNVQLTRFFRWFYSPDIEPDKRQKPKVIENIPRLKRKEKSIYKPDDSRLPKQKGGD